MMLGFVGFFPTIRALGADAPTTPPAGVEQWGIFEIALKGPADANPFADVSLAAQFSQDQTRFNVAGFYDGDGVYRIRFMPPTQGLWKYQTQSDRPELNAKEGQFTCTKPSAGNHGPVRVRNVFHFAYADGTPFIAIGTTAYGWIHQPQELQEQTLQTLKSSPFNKLRMCVLPTHNQTDDPNLDPFARKPDHPDQEDLTRFNPTFFQLLEKRLGQMRDMNVEADIILFHPYARRQYANMGAANDDRYLRYVVARLAAFRNVWWAMANEYDLLRDKTDADWDRFFQIVQKEDPYGHLRSIHQNHRMYDMSKPWITHVSAQNGSAVAELGRAPIYRQLMQKPIVFDEVRYEGNLDKRWGNLSAEEMVLRFWVGTIGGTYVGHGESLVEQGKPSWLGQGGAFRGQSPARIAFLKKILESAPNGRVDPIDQYFEDNIAGKPGEFYLLYFGRQQPGEWPFELYRDGLADGMQFHVDVLDTWNMTITPIQEPFTLVRHNEYVFHAAGERKVPLPGRQWMALRIARIAAAAPGHE
jgi:hypothetical protein